MAIRTITYTDSYIYVLIKFKIKNTRDSKKICEHLLLKISVNSIFTDVGEIVQSFWSWSVEHHFSTNQQGESVKQSVDGVTRLVDGQNDGSSVTGHSENSKKN